MRAILLSAAILARCAVAADDAKPPTPTKESAPVNDTQFHPRLLEIAASYTTYGRVDDELRLAPIRCGAFPGAAEASKAQLSSSTDDTTHGKKLYFVFAKDQSQYKWSPSESAAGQIVVKEAWLPKEVPSTTPLNVVTEKVKVSAEEREKLGIANITDNFIPYAKIDGKVYHADTKSALFIMYKLDPKTPDTDEGWVYGTVSADGKEVTSAGKVQSCMSCHTEAPHGRLFGMKKQEKEDASR